ncbi:GGDEF domain-containing protein [Enterovibrio coralii]|uniref:GGDEF domain-containing protein n=1 Tax=Enterovibrio coralii TaxID=294935 RepID=UPI000AD14230|nr:GGDEF domain-containing protein [Enterovibrio coralii]
MILILVLASVALTDFYLVDLHSIDESSRRLVHDDLLTETANSQSIYNQADELYFQAQRKEIPLSVIAINLDDFRQINDMHGRSTGDQVLIHYANLLQEHITPGTPISRLYADTFVILLNNVNATEAVALAEELKIAISRSVVLLEHTAVKRTASLGVSTSNQGCIAGYQLIDTALVAMKNAKRRGKNKIQSVSPTNINPMNNRDYCRPS